MSAIKSQIIDDLYQKGLIQFGRFYVLNDILAVRFHLELLPSYPRLHSKVVQLFIEKVDRSIQLDYVLATYDAIPLGTMIADALKLPLLMQFNSGTTPASRIIGSYDIGHPTLIISNSSDNLDILLSDCTRVGLEVEKILAIVQEKSASDKTETFINQNDIENLRDNIL